MLEFNRRDIKAMIMGPKPPKGPESKNVLWMDTHSAVPLLRVWLNERWTAVENTDSETIHIDFEGVKADVRELQSYFRQDRSIVVTNVDCRGGLLKLGDTELLESQLITFLGFDDRITALEQKETVKYTAGDNIIIEGDVISAIDTTYNNATEETSGLMSYQDKIKLNGLNNYILPKASASVLGGIKVGDTLTIDANGVLNSLSSVSIDDTTISTTKTWSSNKINSELSSKQDTLIAGENIDITDNTVSAVGYKFNGDTNGGFAEKYKQDAADGGQVVENTATGLGSHAEGYNTTASGYYSHSEGYNSKAQYNVTHAEGNSTTASGDSAHSEGNRTKASGKFAHAEGDSCIAKGVSAHAEGRLTLANGIDAHSEGYSTVASGNQTHAEGQFTKTSCNAEHAQGSYNKSHKATYSFDGNAGNTLHSIGIGTADDARKNAVEVMQNGDIYVYGLGNYDGTATKLDNPGVMTLQDILKNIADATGVNIGALF